VWFVVIDDAIYVQSRPQAAKLANIRANGKVSFHLDGDGAGGDIVTIDADAEVLDAPPLGLVDAYSEKYERVIRERIRTTPEAMMADYNTTVRVVPRRVRAW
jgi:PPOX class probable F420-dependent enzyme